jgi:predicted DsbA family dithiol-disulfide isomerase
MRHMPLEMHPKAKLAAVAMQAARRQGKDRVLHDAMLANRKMLDRADLVGYAKAAELDVAKFEADLDDPSTTKEVDDDMALGLSVGATATPTSFINGVPVRGAKTYETFAAIVQNEIAEADKLLAAGTAIADVYRLRCEANVKAGPRE